MDAERIYMNSTEEKDTNIIDFAEEKECREFSDLLNAYEEVMLSEEEIDCRINAFKARFLNGVDDASAEQLEKLEVEILSGLQTAFVDYSDDRTNNGGDNEFLREKLIRFIKDYDVFGAVFNDFMADFFSKHILPFPAGEGGNQNDQNGEMPAGERSIISKIEEVFASAVDLFDAEHFEVSALEKALLQNFDVVKDYFTLCFEFVSREDNVAHSTEFSNEIVGYSIMTSNILYYPLWDYLEVRKKI